MVGPDFRPAERIRKHLSASRHGTEPQTKPNLTKCCDVVRWSVKLCAPDTGEA